LIEQKILANKNRRHLSVFGFFVFIVVDILRNGVYPPFIEHVLIQKITASSHVVPNSF